MKPKKTKTIIAFIALLLSLSASAQIVTFGYDAAGNRELREVIYLKTTEADSSKQIKEYTELLGETKVTISPNPSGGRFKVKIEGGETETPAEIYLHSLNGTLIYENRMAGLLTEVNISNRQNGTYILTLLISGKRETWKVIKQ